MLEIQPVMLYGGWVTIYRGPVGKVLLAYQLILPFLLTAFLRWALGGKFCYKHRKLLCAACSVFFAYIYWLQPYKIAAKGPEATVLVLISVLFLSFIAFFEQPGKHFTDQWHRS